MKKLLAFALILAFALSLLTGCGEGSDAAPDSGGDASDDAPANAKPGDIEKQTATVNPGDAAFANDNFTLTYNSVIVNSIAETIMIRCEVKSNIPMRVQWMDAPFVINGTATDIVHMSIASSDEFSVEIPISELENLGLSPEDVKTVQVLFKFSKWDDYDDVLFEGTVVFNIDLP